MSLRNVAGTWVVRGLLLIGCVVWTTPTTRADQKDELKARFAERAAAIRKYKDAGKIGEDTAGLIEGVSAVDPAVQKLIDAENADRQALYALIAKDQGTDAATVANRAARRNYEKAKTGDYLKTAAGEWKRKRKQ